MSLTVGLSMKFILIIPLIFLSVSFAWSNERNLMAAVFYIEPFGFKNQAGEVSGITSDIIKAIENKSGIKIDQTLLPYKRMLVFLETGEIDFAIFFRSKLSETITESIIPLYELRTVVVGRKGSKISTYNDIYKLKLATPLGVQYKPQFDDDTQLKITNVNDYDSAISMLQRNYVDAVISPEKILHYQLKKMGIKKEILGEPYVLTTNTAWLQFSKKSRNKPAIATLKSSIEALKKDNTIDQILDSYFN
jgi:ABC-type amino acid transport substrate-binding protein